MRNAETKIRQYAAGIIRTRRLNKIAECGTKTQRHRGKIRTKTRVQKILMENAQLGRSAEIEETGQPRGQVPPQNDGVMEVLHSLNGKIDDAVSELNVRN